MTSQQSKILVVGSINMDLVSVVARFPKAGETIIASRSRVDPGGKGANQAVAASRFGASVKLIGRVGDDSFGSQLLTGLLASGIDATDIAVDQVHPTGLAFIEIEEISGENQIIVMPGANIAIGEIDSKKVVNALKTIDMLLLQLEINLDVILDLVKQSSNIGCPVLLNPAPPCQLPLDLYPLINIITPNQTEAEALVGFPINDIESGIRAAELLKSRGVETAIITMGKQGLVFSDSNGHGHMPSYDVTAIDTVGAGDAFNGTLAAAITEGQTLRNALRRGAAAGALATTKYGAQNAMPTRDEVEKFLARLNIL